MSTNNIPVFYHIPKNSGTYVFRCFLSEARKHNKNKVQIVRVLLENKYVIAKLIVLNNSDFLNQCNNFTPLNDSKISWNLLVEDLTEDILQKLSIHSVFIEGRGFRYTETSLKPLFLFLAQFKLYEFIMLREPFSREQSLYHYLTSDKSKHEHSHGRFTSSSFEEHILSRELQDSWLIRAILDLPYRGKLTLSEDYFIKARNILQKFNVYDVKDTDKAIKEILLKCFNIQEFNTEDLAHKKHDNIYKKIKFEELPLDVQTTFKERKYWDQKLYNYFIKQCQEESLQ